MNKPLDYIKDRVKTLFSEISDLESSIHPDLTKTGDKSHTLKLGTGVMRLHSLLNVFMELCTIIKEGFETPLSEISKDVEAYYNNLIFIEKAKAPASEEDSEELKKMREYIQNIKNN